MSTGSMEYQECMDTTPLRLLTFLIHFIRKVFLIHDCTMKVTRLHRRSRSEISKNLPKAQRDSSEVRRVRPGGIYCSPSLKRWGTRLFFDLFGGANKSNERWSNRKSRLKNLRHGQMANIVGRMSKSSALLGGGEPVVWGEDPVGGSTKGRGPGKGLDRGYEGEEQLSFGGGAPAINLKN